MPFEGKERQGGLFKGLNFHMRRVCMPYYVISNLNKQEASHNLMQSAEIFSDFTPDSPRLLMSHDMQDKVQALRSVLTKLPDNSKLHYIDSDQLTLQEVAKDQNLQDVDLYLAAWSSENPEGSLEKLGSLVGQGKIALLQLDEFGSTMQWGFGLGDQIWDTYLECNDGAPMEPKGKI
mmetsp:Transcript_11879/g.21696  ORF Transcript_11879/g.21696 Transcript_11879/m.21696 type:complete len:177 (+) Transcript_11879:103-633(+)